MRYSSVSCTATVTVPGRAQAVEVCLKGEVDRDNAPMLADVTGYLIVLAPGQVVVELGQLGFAGSALPNWLARMRGELQNRSSVVVRHPQPLVRRILAMTEMTHLVDDISST